jgi:cobalt-zinc-cadmium efflux system outer membrane protein
MQKLCAALLAAASCASVAHAQAGPPAPITQAGPIYSLDQAVVAAGGSAPSTSAATAAIEAARAGRTVAGLRPNPVFQGQIENITGSGPYRGVRAAETTVGFAIPIELGGKRSARVGVANAQLSRAEIQAAIIAADVRLQVTQLYVEAVAAERRVTTARDQARIAGDALRAASVRVQAGRASPLEQQRADVARINAEANVERQLRLSDAARANLARRIGQPIDGRLDETLLDRLPDAAAYGPAAPVRTVGTLALAAADADFSIADAGAGSRAPIVCRTSTSVRRCAGWKRRTTPRVFTVSIPIPVFNNGRAAIAQATAQRTQADALRRVTALDIEQAITTRRLRRRTRRRPRVRRPDRLWRPRRKRLGSRVSDIAKASSGNSNCSTPNAPSPRRASPRSTRSPTTRMHARKWSG